MYSNTCCRSETRFNGCSNRDATRASTQLWPCPVLPNSRWVQSQQSSRGKDEQATSRACDSSFNLGKDKASVKRSQWMRAKISWISLHFQERFPLLSFSLSYWEKFLKTKIGGVALEPVCTQMEQLILWMWMSSLVSPERRVPLWGERVFHPQLSCSFCKQQSSPHFHR